MFAWWGRTVYRFRYAVIGVMVALCLGGGIYGISLGQHVTQSGFYDDGSQSVHASVISDEAYGRDTSGHIVAIYTAPDGKTVDDPAFQKKVLDNLAQVEKNHPDQILRSIGYFKSPELLKTMADADKKHSLHVRAAQGRQRRPDPEQLQQERRLGRQDRQGGTEHRRRQRSAGRPAAAGQRADRHHRRGPEARRGGRHPAGLRGAVLRVRHRDRGRASRRHRRPDHRGRPRHHAPDRRVHPRALLRPAGGDPDGARHRGRLRPVHGEPIPGGARRGLRHRGRRPTNGDDLGPHHHVLRGDPGGVVGTAAAVPAGLPQVDHLRDHRLGHAGGDPVDHGAGRRPGHPRASRRLGRREDAGAFRPARSHRLRPRQSAHQSPCRGLDPGRDPASAAGHRIRAHRPTPHQDDR